jgi:hypothetical protein
MPLCLSFPEQVRLVLHWHDCPGMEELAMRHQPGLAWATLNSAMEVSLG